MPEIRTALADDVESAPPKVQEQFHRAIRQACDALLFHPECPKFDGAEGLATAMTAALEAAGLSVLLEMAYQYLPLVDEFEQASDDDELLPYAEATLDMEVLAKYKAFAAQHDVEVFRWLLS